MSTIVLNRVGRPLLLGALFYLFHWGAYGAYMPFLTVYFAKLGFSGGQFGLLAMLFPLGILLCSPPLSALADRTHSRMRLLQLALTGVVLTFLMLGYPTRFGTVAVVMGVLAIVRSPVLALADTLIVQLAVRNGIHYGNLRLVGSFGFALFSIGCGWLWQRWGYQPMFWITALLFVPTIWLAGQLGEAAAAATNVEHVPLRTVLQDRYLLMLLITTGLMGITLGIAIIFEGIVVDALGGGQALIGLFLGIIGLSEIPGMRIAGALTRRLGDERTLLLSYLIFGGSFVGYIMAGGPAILMLFGALRGVGFGLFLATTITTFNDRAPVAWAATVQSLRDAVMFGLAPLLVASPAGLLYDQWGIAAPFVLAVTTAALALIILFVTGARLSPKRALSS